MFHKVAIRSDAPKNFEFQNRERIMTLSSALESLRSTTLKAIAGSLQKLAYLADLQRKGARGGHWGLERVYGDLAAQKAVEEAHREVVSSVLTTPLSRLRFDVTESCHLAGEETQGYLDELSSRGKDLLPANPGAGSARHLSSVLQALRALSKHRKPDATRPTVSRRPRLDPEPPLAVGTSVFAPARERAGEIVR